jgi:ribosomal protein S18 acetylase RimI-like enzyme
VIVRTFSVIASRTFVTPAALRRSRDRLVSAANIPACRQRRRFRRCNRQNASTPDTAEAVDRLLATDPGALPVAERDGAMVGALIAAWDGWRGNMYRLAVDAGHRRLGVALALVRARERRLAGCGARRITALVAHGDAPAMGPWRAAGYTHDTAIARFVKQLGD